MKERMREVAVFEEAGAKIAAAAEKAAKAKAAADEVAAKAAEPKAAADKAAEKAAARWDERERKRVSESKARAKVQIWEAGKAPGRHPPKAAQKKTIEYCECYHERESHN